MKTRHVKHILLSILSFVLVLLLGMSEGWLPIVAVAQNTTFSNGEVIDITPPAPPQFGRVTDVPTLTDGITHDLDNLTFDSLPAFETPGSFTLDPSISSQVGFDLPSGWEVGQTPSEVLTLGTIEGIEFKSIDDIEALSQKQLTGISADAVSLVTHQTIGTLFNAVPSLGDLDLGAATPFVSAVESVAKDYAARELTKLATGKIGD